MEGYKVFKNLENNFFAYHIETQQEMINQAIANRWEEIEKDWSDPSPVTIEQITQKIRLLIYDNIDDFVKNWGYFSVVTAVSYVSSTNPQYAADAVAIVAWRDQVWSWFYGEISNITVNTDPQTFILNMPSPPEKPVV